MFNCPCCTAHLDTAYLPPLWLYCRCRYHSKALLVTFDSDNSASSHVDVLTREVQEGFKRLDGEIRGMAAGEAGGGEDDAQVGRLRMC